MTYWRDYVLELVRHTHSLEGVEEIGNEVAADAADNPERWKPHQLRAVEAVSVAVQEELSE